MKLDFRNLKQHIEPIREHKDIILGLVVSRFNSLVTEKLALGAWQALQELRWPDDKVLQVSVPGALEIPLATKFLFDKGCSGVVAIGAVIRGETTHYDSVCRGVENGCCQLQLTYDRPIGFGVLTTESETQAMARAGGEHGNKGFDAVFVTFEMMSLSYSLKRRSYGFTDR